MANNLKNTFQKDNKKIFYIISIVFFFILLFADMFYDDITGMRVESGTIVDYWQKSVELYFDWSSRIFVNFVVFLFTDNKNTYIWALFMGISLYVLMFSFSKLFATKENEGKCNVVIACLTMLFPFQYLNSAGWISTMTTYLSPTAFGFLSLLPLKKIDQNEKFKWYEYIIYSLSLLYGANNEQMMVVVLGCYIIGALYFIYNKKFTFYLFIQSALTVASFLIVMLCPGNRIRKNREIFNWFKTWRMFNAIDKADLGYSTTMQNLLFGSHIFIIVICCLFTYMIWKKYRKTSYAMIAGIPTALMIAFGPLKDIVITMYPNIEGLTEPIERNGLVTVANRGDFKAFGKYLIWAAMLTMICAAVLLLQDNLKMLVTSFVLLGTGMASRIVIGFSPTIYASKERTFTILYFCIIAVACNAYSNSLEKGYIDNRESPKIEIALSLLLICSMINLIFLVGGGT